MAQIRTDKAWHGIKQMTVAASLDPDAAEVRVKLPASWGQAAADAVAAILPGKANIDLANAAEHWVGPIAARALAAAGLTASSSAIVSHDAPSRRSRRNRKSRGAVQVSMLAVMGNLLL